MQRGAVLVRHFEAVFLQQRHHFIVEVYEPLGQDGLDLGVADLKLTEGIEVDLVDRTARCNEPDMHHPAMLNADPVRMNT